VIHVALGDVVEIKGGGTPSKSNAAFYTGDIPWVTPKDMKVWDITTSIDKITADAISESTTTLVPKGAVLLVNRSGILKHTLPVGITRRPVAINQDMKALICGPRVDADYLGHLVKAAEPIILRWVRATTADNFPIKNLRELEIPLPPLEEQKRIAAILDQADALRRLRARALDRLNALGQSIFHEMFGDLKTNPKGWGKSKLAQICEVGSSKRVFVEEFVSTGIPFYRGTEVGQLGASGEVHPSLFIAEDHYEALIQHSGKPQIGDLLLPSICHDGRIWRVDTDAPFYFKDGRVLWIKSSQASIDGEFLRRYLQQVFLTSYSSIASGTTFAELKIVNLKGLDVLVPPADVQHTFAKRMAAVDAQKLDAASALGRLTALFATLQSKAFAGGL
jgi:type I restriction enzyme S subunit